MMRGTSSSSTARNWRPRSGFYIGLVALALLVLIQATVAARLRFFGVRPNLLLIAVACWSLLSSVEDGLLWAFIGGLGIDLLAGMPIGSSSLALMPTCFLAGLGRNNLFAGSLLLPIVMVLLATPLQGWIIMALRQLQGVPVEWLGTSLRVILPEAGINAILVPLVYPLMRALAIVAHVDKMEI